MCNKKEEKENDMENLELATQNEVSAVPFDENIVFVADETIFDGEEVKEGNESDTASADVTVN